MKYEVSNIIFRQKPSGEKMGRKYPFKRLKEQVHLVEDTPYNLYLTYKRGFSVKPHPFSKDTLHNAKVNCIVLDFDNLTPLQKEFVDKVVNGIYSFGNIYGDYSAGTKTRLYENRDIPNYENPKWGYKVFYPADCLCVWKELNEAFIQAVAFFNPCFSLDEVRTIWRKWLKVNNRKGADGIDNPIFKYWILPDVAMLNSFRTQITYSVRPELKKDYILQESDWEKNTRTDDLYSTFAFPAGGKDDYSGLEWRPEDVIDDNKDTTEEIHKAWEKVIGEAIDLEAMNAIENPDDLRLLIPTSKSLIARRLNKQKFDDLVWDQKANGILNGRLYAKIIDFDIAKQIGRESAKTLTNDLLEMEHQRNINFPPTDSMRNNIHALCHDILVVVRQRCGLTIFKKKGIDDDFKKSVSRAVVKAANNFCRFRAKLKLMSKEQEWNPPHLELLRKYTTSQDKAVLNEYNKARNQWLLENLKIASQIRLEYTYKKKGLKKWLISTACLDFTIEELKGFGLEPVRLEDEQKWIDWCRNALARREDDFNDVEESDLRRWWKDYQREYNAKYGDIDGRIQKEHKAHKSKWNQVFQGKSKEEIESIIQNRTDLSKQMKCFLRRKFMK